MPPQRGAEEALRCEMCGAGELAGRRVQTALWEDERLVVVEDVPAMVCTACGERFLSDEVAMQLDALRGTGFPPDGARREMTVPVFRLPRTQKEQGDDKA
jgi:YgiT-type zinc finger domain-containing protein